LLVFPSLLAGRPWGWLASLAFPDKQAKMMKMKDEVPFLLACLF